MSSQVLLLMLLICFASHFGLVNSLSNRISCHSLNRHGRFRFRSQSQSQRSRRFKTIPNSPTQLNSWELPTLDFLSHGIGNIDQLVQGALNSATETAPLISNSPVTTNVPELNLLSLEEESGALNPLGNDLLIFLCATIGIVPLFKWLKASPVIGFLSAGLLMGPAGLKLFSDLNDMESLADFGVLFLLFEQGLELTVDRLKSLSRYAFGMGSLQVVLCTAAFFIFPFIGGVQFLEVIVGSQPAVVDITRVDEALVIGAALSLSSSAFVLKVLQEKGQLSSRFGAASLGILLLQDIAVVPLLVLLPIIESNSGPMPLSAQLTLLGGTFLKAIFGLSGILFIGGRFVRFLFQLVAQTRSSETFVALCLLVALGTGALTDTLGLSSTLGAFTAGTLLAESNYRTQIESDIKPFRGLLLGLFFLTTGASVDPIVIQEQFPTVLALLAGLITFKAVLTSLLGPFFGLTKSESVRAGLLLSGGGEFAFVVLTLADKLHVLPDQLAKILVGVVVLSMAMTPYLSNLGDWVGERVDKWEKGFGGPGSVLTGMESGKEMGTDRTRSGVESPEDTLKDELNPHNFSGSDDDVVVICGFGYVGETIARILTSPEILVAQASESGGGKRRKVLKYCAFDLDPSLVMNGFKAGKKVLYGDGSQPMVLSTAGIENPKAFVVTYSDKEMCFKTVERLREAFPNTPILSRSVDMEEYYHLLEAGASKVVPEERDTSLLIGSSLLTDLGFDSGIIRRLIDNLRADIDLEIQDNWQVMNAKKTGGVFPYNQKSDRVNERDRQSLLSRITQGSESLNILLEDAARKLKNVIDAPRSWERDDESFEAETSSINSAPILNSNSTKEPSSELGVTVCYLPPKGKSSSSKTN